MDWSSQLNPHAAPFVPSSRPSLLTETMRGIKDPGKQVGDTEKHETADSSALPDLSLDYYCERLGKIRTSTKSASSKGSGVENHSPMVRCISRMFQDVATDFIFEALKAHDFDAISTMNMMFHLCAPGYHGESAEASAQQQPLFT